MQIQTQAESDVAMTKRRHGNHVVMQAVLIPKTKPDIVSEMPPGARNYFNKEQMIQAATEASKRKAELGLPDEVVPLESRRIARK
nr:hypothetical protein [Tanacetum cinerariifolium]